MIKNILAEAGCKPLNAPANAPVASAVAQLIQIASPQAPQIERDAEKINNADLELMMPNI
jgi:hypothetical protein